MATHKVYRFYAELKDFEPKIWRRFEINGSKSMAELGYALMVLFEMQASHLFCFREEQGKAVLEKLRAEHSEEVLKRALSKKDIQELSKDTRYEIPYENDFPDGEDIVVHAAQCRICDVVYSADWNAVFEYDYGDGWEIAIQFEGAEKREIVATELPCLLEGAGFGIIEDAGGVGGLTDLVKAYTQKKGEDYEHYCRWLGLQEFDINAFDIDDLNFRLKKIPRIYKESYELGYEPTQRSIDLILRKYLI